MICPNCGMPLPADSQFCAGCGRALSEARVVRRQDEPKPLPAQEESRQEKGKKEAAKSSKTPKQRRRGMLPAVILGVCVLLLAGLSWTQYSLAQKRSAEIQDLQQSLAEMEKRLTEQEEIISAQAESIQQLEDSKEDKSTGVTAEELDRILEKYGNGHYNDPLVVNGVIYDSAEEYIEEKKAEAEAKEAAEAEAAAKAAAEESFWGRRLRQEMAEFRKTLGHWIAGEEP